MSQPVTYDRVYNFTEYQALNPTVPLPAGQVDLELNTIKISLDQTQANLALIQRDDGQLANSSVGFDQLKAELSVGVSPATLWLTLTNYQVTNVVFFGLQLYRALVSHISGVFATDLAAGRWVLVADFTPPAHTIANDRLIQRAARSVMGNAGNATADLADIAGTADQVLRVNGAGTALAFGSLDLSKAAAVGTSILPVANGGTGVATAQTAAATLRGNPTAAPATFTDFTIQGLTTLASPHATLDFVVVYDHVTGTLQKATPSGVGSAGAVSSVDAKTGAFTLEGGLVSDVNKLVIQQMTPGGRVTLTPSTPVPTTDVTGATTVYFAPLANGTGGFVPLFNGTITRLVPFVSSDTDTVGLSMTLGAAWALNSNFYTFVATDSGTVRFGTGPAWSSDTVVGTGAGTCELEFYQGRWVNKNSMVIRYANASTFTAAARTATCVGGFRTVLAGQAEDSKAKRYVFNVYNWAPRVCTNVTETGGDDPYTLTTPRQARANAANQLDLFIGLAGVCVEPKVTAIASTSAGGSFAAVGIGYDSAVLDSSQERAPTTNTNRGLISASLRHYPAIGRHTYTWLEFCQGVSGTNTYTYSGSAYQSGISATVWM